MRKVIKLSIREYLAAVRTKGFIIGLILAPVLMSGGLVAMALLGDQVDTKDKRVAVVDRTGTIGPALVEAAQERNAREVHHPRTGEKVRPAYLIELVAPDETDPDAQRLELSDRVRDQMLHAFVEVGPEVLHPRPGSPDSRVLYYARSGALDDLRGWIAMPINDELRRQRLAEVNLELAELRHLFAWIEVESLGLVEVTRAGEITQAAARSEAEAIFLPMFSQLLLFMLILMGSTPLIQSIMEEKTQRIAEVVLGSVSPFQLMIGKLLGGVAVSLTASAVYVLGGIVALVSMSMTAFIPYHVLPWFFAYMLSAVFLFGAVFAAVGSACSDPKDAQSLQVPAMLPVFIPLFLLVPMLKEPHSTMGTVLSLFPPFTPMLMVLRLSTPGGVPAWQPWLGLAGVLAFTVLCVWISSRIFRVGILMQGKPPRLTDLVRWAIQG
jgi:ABC-2 type transport system permease protein